MKTLVIACEVLKQELEFLLNKLDNPPEIIFTKPSLHDVPKKMNIVLQEELDNIPKDVKRVLFAYGICGGSMNGLETGDYELVLPKTDDCIPLLLGSKEKYFKESEIATYFLTKGWAEFTSQGFERDIENVGEEKTISAYKTMLANYERYLYIDTGFNTFDESIQVMAKHIDAVPLRVEKTAGQLGWLKEFLLGPWSEEKYFIFPPKSIIGEEDDLLLY